MFNVRKRINRTTFLLGDLLISGLIMPLYLADDAKLEQLETKPLIAIMALVLFFSAVYFTICLLIRRLHDVGLFGWFVIFALLPGGQLVLLVLPGQKLKNKYGEPPNKKFDWQTIFSS